MAPSDEREELRQRAAQLETQLQGTKEKLQQVDEALRQEGSEDEQQAQELAALRAEVQTLRAEQGQKDGSSEKKTAPTKNPSAKDNPPIALWRLALATGASGLLWIPLVYLSANFIHFVATFAIASLFAVIGTWGWVGTRWGGEAAGIMFGLCMLGVIGSLGSPALFALLYGRGAEGISVRDIGRYQDASWYRFRDGEVKADKRGRYVNEVRNEGRTTKREYQVAPLVPDNWHVTDPVPAWVACSDSASRCVTDWPKPLRAAHPARFNSALHLNASSLEHARKNSEKRFKLRSAAGAPFLMWTADPRQRLAPQAKMSLGLPAAGYFIALMVVAYRRFSRWRKAR